MKMLRMRPEFKSGRKRLDWCGSKVRFPAGRTNEFLKTYLIFPRSGLGTNWRSDLCGKWIKNNRNVNSALIKRILLTACFLLWKLLCRMITNRFIIFFIHIFLCGFDPHPGHTFVNTYIYFILYFCNTSSSIFCDTSA